jgi:protein tyrosine/serine phosphatase
MKLKYLFFSTIFVSILFGLYLVYQKHLNYNFETITQNRVYKSAKIPPAKIKDYVKKYKIKTIIDLRNPAVITKDNPADIDDIDLEKEAVAKIDGLKYYNIQSNQVPTKNTLKRFFEVMDNNSSYPVLIHCHHGVGRAVIYSAIYRIEYEHFSNEEARDKTRFLLYKSSFDKGREKGDFLINYKPRITSRNIYDKNN